MKTTSIPRLSSYNKLKIANEKLKMDIFNLVKNPNTIEGQLVKTQYLLQYSTDEAMMFGDASLNDNKFSGILGGV